MGSIEECIPSFIRKTYKILEDDQSSDVICWNEEGTAIVIKNPSEFAQTILPIYFKHNNLNSFIRQLNMYGFHKKKTPDGDHVYYHELFQRDKRYLLKNIRRKSTENSALHSDKLRLDIELGRAKQDINSIMNENLFLKKINKEAMTTIKALEARLGELNLQNQAFLTQLLKNNEKEELLKSFAPAFKRDPQYPLSNIDLNVPDNLATMIPQTTTRIPRFTEGLLDPRLSNTYMYSENDPGSNLQTYFDPQSMEEKRKRGFADLGKDKELTEGALVQDLSQQIVKNMDQELQYLKQLTSSNTNLERKRRMEIETGRQNLAQYENINKFYKPDSVFGFNFLPGQLPVEGTGVPRVNEH